MLVFRGDYRLENSSDFIYGQVCQFSLKKLKNNNGEKYEITIF